MCANRKDIDNLSLDSFYRISTLLPLFSQHSFFHLLSVFRLLTNCNFVTIVHEYFNVLFEMIFVETNNFLQLTWRNAQVHKGVTNRSILIVDDKPLAISVQHNFVKI